MPNYEALRQAALANLEDKFVIFKKITENLFICGPKREVQEAKHSVFEDLNQADRADRVNRVLKDLRDNLVAVKISTQSSTSGMLLGQEAFLLERINKTPNSRPRIWFPELLHAEKFYFPPAKLCSSLEMSAFDPALTLQTFRTHFEKVPIEIPVEFIAHVFLQLCELVGFLHKNCRISHNDIHECNILVNCEALPGTHELPQLALVDFGLGLHGKSLEGGAIARDVKFICTELNRLLNTRCLGQVTTSPENAARFEGFEEFKTFMREKSDKDVLDRNGSIDGLKTLFEAQAKRCVDSCPEKTAKYLDNLAQGLGKPAKVSDREVMDVLANLTA